MAVMTEDLYRILIKAVDDLKITRPNIDSHSNAFNAAVEKSKMVIDKVFKEL